MSEALESSPSEWVGFKVREEKDSRRSLPRLYRERLDIAVSDSVERDGFSSVVADSGGSFESTFAGEVFADPLCDRPLILPVEVAVAKTAEGRSKTETRPVLNEVIGYNGNCPIGRDWNSVENRVAEFGSVAEEVSVTRSLLPKVSLNRLDGRDIARDF